MIELKDGLIADGQQQAGATPLAFTVDEGEALAVGGSPKTATLLLHCLLGLQALAQGHVTIDGDALLPRTAAYFRSRMAYVSADCKIFGGTVEELTRTLFHLNVNAELQFHKSHLMEAWQQLGLDASLYEQPFCDLSAETQWLVQVSLTSVLHKAIVVIDTPAGLHGDALSERVARFLRSDAFAHSAIILATNDETLAAACDKRITLPQA